MASAIALTIGYSLNFFLIEDNPWLVPLWLSLFYYYFIIRMEKLTVTKIVSSNATGMSEVEVNRSTFLAIAPYTTKVPWNPAFGKNSEDLRVFKLDGYKVITCTKEIEGTHLGSDGKEYQNTKTSCYMKTEDANKIKIDLDIIDISM